MAAGDGTAKIQVFPERKFTLEEENRTGRYRFRVVDGEGDKVAHSTESFPDKAEAKRAAGGMVQAVFEAVGTPVHMEASIKLIEDAIEVVER